MAKLLNLDSASNADIQSSDSDTTLALKNTSGRALSVNRLDIDGDILAANATVAGLRIRGASAASGALISFTGLKALASCTTIAFTTGGVAGTYAARVALPSGLFGWIPILPDSAITAVVV